MCSPLEKMAQIAELVRTKKEMEEARQAEVERATQIFRSNIGLMLIECNQAGVGQNALGDLIGTSSQNIANWREGTEPRLSHLFLLRQVWGMDFMDPIKEGSFYRILTGQDKGLYLRRAKLKSVPSLV